MDPQRERRIAENLARVREQIAAAARLSGRAPDAVRLIAVTKYAALSDVQALVAAGCPDLGESRPQDLWTRAEALRDCNLNWHFIGHLQRNKVERTVPLVSLLHSADSERLIVALDAAAAKINCVLPILLEVNISGEAAKHGFAPLELEPLLPSLSKLKNIQIRGLMGMAALEGGSDRARQDFARLRELRDRLRANCPATIVLDELSMGMSGDFTEAIAEGATLVRVGSALFEGLEETAT